MPEPIGPYVRVVKHNSVLYLSGVTAFGTLAQSESAAAKVKDIFSQIEKMAQAENSSLANIIKITAFATDLVNIAEVRKVLVGIYGNHLPASSAIQISALFMNDLHVEIEAIIAIPAEQ